MPVPPGGKHHIWYRRDGATSPAFCLGCGDDKTPFLVGAPCAGKPAGAEALDACPTCWRLMPDGACRVCGVPKPPADTEIAAAAHPG